MTDLTIVTVSYFSHEYIRLNWRLTCRLNPKTEFKWLIMDNTPNSKPLHINDHRFFSIKGISDVPKKLGDGSYHHAASLNKALLSVTTKYALFLDPDFFIILPHWIDQVVNHMKEKKLSFFGAPYYPDRFVKYRYFPCGICLFVDLSSVPKNDLDFTPEIHDYAFIYSLPPYKLLTWFFFKKSPTPKYNLTEYRDMLYTVLWKKIIYVLMLGHTGPISLSAGSSRDTGYRIYRKFFNNPNFKYENLMPVWENFLYSSSSSIVHSLKKLIARFIIPDNLCYYPKRRDYSTTVSFRNFYLPDLIKYGWEEYLWYDQPFGFHIRGVFQKIRSVEKRELVDILDTCVRKIKQKDRR